MSIRVFLLDDHEIVRRGLRDLIESDPQFEVVDEAGTVRDALIRIPACTPDVAVLDVRLPDGSGVEVCREVRSATPSVACLMLTSYSDDEALFEAIMAGSSGYLLKQVSSGELLTALKRVADGESLLDPSLTSKVLDRIRNPVAADDRLRDLSDQEHRVLNLLAEGLTNREIAAELHLAEKTVKNYVSNLLTKMGMAHRTGAAVYAARLSERQSRSTGT